MSDPTPSRGVSAGGPPATTSRHSSTGEEGEGVASRQAAATAMVRITTEQSWASPVVDKVLTAGGLDARDRSFAANLVFSTVRMQGTLEWVLAPRVTRGMDQVEDELQAVLHLGTWELLYGHAPSHAVVHAWVEVARALVGDRATGFVNGILRAVDRHRDDLPWPDESTDAGVALRLGYPEWIVTAARQRFGADRLGAALAAGNAPAPLVLRAVAPRDQIIAELTAQGIAATPGTMSRDAVVLTDRHVPSDLQPVRDGTAIVQDQASQVVGLLVAEGIPAGATAIDLCAAPGGKTTHLAQQGLQVTAVDRHAGRLRQVQALADRLGLPVQTLLADGTDTGLPEGSADLVLVDAPCTGLGVVRRRPELRWRRSAEDVPVLAAIQRDLLRAACRLVRPGGRVGYSVCTWTEAETDAVVEAVLGDGDVEILPAAGAGTPTVHGTQMAPDTDDGDGMYVALLQRKE